MSITRNEVQEIARAIAIANGHPSPDDWATQVEAAYKSPYAEFSVAVKLQL